MTVKINYKGALKARPFDYKCTGCTNESTIIHKADTLDVYSCVLCDKPLERHIKAAPAMDADLRQGNLFCNLGWESEGGYDG